MNIFNLKKKIAFCIIIFANLLLFTENSFSKTTSFLPKEFSAIFQQSHKSAIKNKIKTSNGLLDYKYPGKIKFQVKSPDDIIFVSNSKRAWYYRAPFIEGEAGEVTVKPAGDMALLKLLDLLQRGLVNNNHYKVKENKNSVLVTFSKSISKNIKVKSINLIFLDSKLLFKTLKEIVINHSNNKKVKLSLKKINTTPKFSKKYFDFEIPKNTKESYN